MWLGNQECALKEDVFDIELINFFEGVICNL